MWTIGPQNWGTIGKPLLPMVDFTKTIDGDGEKFSNPFPWKFDYRPCLLCTLSFIFQIFFLNVLLIMLIFLCHLINFGLLALVTTWPSNIAVCMSYKFGHQMAPLALVPNLATRWLFLRWLQIWLPDGSTCISSQFGHQLPPLESLSLPHYLGLPYLPYFENLNI